MIGTDKLSDEQPIGLRHPLKGKVKMGTAVKPVRRKPAIHQRIALDEIFIVTMPTTEQEHEDAVWNLGQGLKGISMYANKTALELKPLVQQWHVKAKPCIGPLEFDDTWARFAEVWGTVKSPLSNLFFAFYYAKHSPDSKVLPYKKPALLLLAKAYRELQRRVGKGEPIFIAGEDAGKFLGVDKKIAWRYARTLEADGILKLVTRGKPREKGGSTLATVYHYRGRM